MGRKLVLGHIDIKTLDNEFTAIIRQDSDTGLIYTGLCGTATTPACTVDNAILQLQRLADSWEDFDYIAVLVVDPAEEELQIWSYRFACDNNYDSTSISLCRAQYHRVGSPQATVGAVPRRWVIKPDTPESRNLLNRYIADIRVKRLDLQQAEQNLEALSKDSVIGVETAIAIAAQKASAAEGA
jgi:hypothetical protein